MNIIEYCAKKQRGEKSTMVTCYDYTSARLLAGTEVDCLLVGDSAAMTMHGFSSTLPVTVEMMAVHTAAVARGAPNKLILGDLPFLSYRISQAKSMAAIQMLMQNGAHAVKLEGAAGNLKLIRHVVDSGVPVMGHLGLTPQSLHALGGYRVQGRGEAERQRLFDEAQALEQVGCFGLVLECVPAQIASEITQILRIPVIGIGAGSGTDGQVLVWQDLLGLNLDFKPKFVKHFVEGASIVQSGIAAFVEAVKTGVYPDDDHSFK